MSNIFEVKNCGLHYTIVYVGLIKLIKRYVSLSPYQSVVFNNILDGWEACNIFAEAEVYNDYETSYRKIGKEEQINFTCVHKCIDYLVDKELIFVHKIGSSNKQGYLINVDKIKGFITEDCKRAKEEEQMKEDKRRLQKRNYKENKRDNELPASPTKDGYNSNRFAERYKQLKGV